MISRFLYLLFLIVGMCYVSSQNPVLTSFDYDNSYGQVTLRFDSLVLAGSLDVSKMHFAGGRGTGWSHFDMVAPFNDVSLQGNTSTVTMYIATDNYAEAVNDLYPYEYQKQNASASNFGRTHLETYMYVDSGAFTTYDNIPCVNIPIENALNVTTYKRDQLNPYLIEFSLNMDSGYLTLEVSEPIGGITASMENGTSLGLPISFDGIAFQSNAYVEDPSDVNSAGNYLQFAFGQVLEVSQDVVSIYTALEDPVDNLYLPPRVISVSNLRRTLVVFIGNDNLNKIKNTGSVGRFQSQTWLSAYKPFLNDTSGNRIALAGLSNFQAAPVTTFSPDVTKPTLVSWTYDVFQGIIELTFSEIVQASSFNYTAFAMTSHESPDLARRTLRLDTTADYTNVQAKSANSIKITLSSDKYDELLAYPELFTNESNSYVAMQSGVCWDLGTAQNKFDNQNASFEYARRVSIYIPDLVMPVLAGAALDMNNRTLDLTFTKDILSSSTQLQYLSIQDASVQAVQTQSIVFDAVLATVVNVVDKRVLNLRLNGTTFDLIKSMNFLGLRKDRTFISITADFITDKVVDRNKVVAVTTSAAAPLTVYVPDQTRPQLVHWFIDMTLNTLTMKFDEPLQSAVNVSAIMLYSDDQIALASTEYLRLHSATVLSNDVGLMVLQLTREEMNEIKVNNALCVQQATCFMAIDETFGKDIETYNVTSGLALSNILQPHSVFLCTPDYGVDTKGPRLVSYYLDLNTRVIHMDFTEPVVVETIRTTAIQLYQNISNLAVNMSLTADTYVSLTSNTEVELTLSNDDFLYLKQIGIGANGTDSVFISIGPELVTDKAGNVANGTETFISVIEYGQTFRVLQATSVVADITGPIATAIYRFPTDHNLTIWFDDIVDFENDFNRVYFNLYSPATAAVVNLHTAGIIHHGDEGEEIFGDFEHCRSCIHINLWDLKDSMYNLGIGDSQQSIGLYVNSIESFVDLPRRNKNRLIASQNALGEGNRLLSFRFDLSTKTVYIPLALKYDFRSWVYTRISFYSSLNFATYELSSADYFNNAPRYDDESTTNMTLVIHLSQATMGGLSSIMDVTQKDHLFLRVQRDAFFDSYGKILASAEELSCTQIRIDTEAPTITDWDLDLGAGSLSMYFSKPILVSSVSLSALKLINRQDTSAEYQLLLTAGTVVASSSVQSSLTVTFNAGVYPTLRDQIHLTGGLALNAASVFLEIAKGFVSDTSNPPNYLNLIAAVNATAARTISYDKTTPNLLSWNIDSNTGTITVTFNEAVTHSTNFASYYLLLQDSSDSTSAQHYLLNSTTILPGTGNTITMTVSETDQNAVNIQTPDLCTSSTNCYLSVKANAVADISPAQNLFEGVLFKYASAVQSYTADVIGPLLKNYELNMQTSELWLHYDEIIDCSTMDLSRYRFQFAEFLGVSAKYYSFLYTSPDCTKYTGRYTKDVYVFLHNTDFMALKATTVLLKTAATTWLSQGIGAATDIHGNPSALILDGYAKQVLEYVGDTVRPTMISYTVSSAKILYLYFDEPVDTSTLDVTQIHFQNSLPPFTKEYYLSAATFYTASTYKTTVQIALLFDYNTIAGDSTIFSAQENTYMSIGSAVYDASGNAVQDIHAQRAKGLGPSIIAWDFDAGMGQLQLLFSEAVNANFTVQGIQFQTNHTRDVTDDFVTLTTASNVTQVDNTMTLFSCNLSVADVNNMKFYGVISQVSSSYMVVGFGLSQSLVASTIVPYLEVVEIFDFMALRVRTLKLDVIPPVVDSFGFNLNSGEVYVRFNEPVRNDSFNPSAVTFLTTDPSYQATSAVLTGSQTIRLVNITTIAIKMTVIDLNNVKIAEAGGRLDTMILAYQAGADYYGNFYQGNTELTPIAMLNSTYDNTPPVLTGAVLNREAGTLELQFDEIVSLDPFRPSFVTVIESNNYGSALYKVALSNFTTTKLTAVGGLLMDLKTFGMDWTNLNQYGNLLATEPSNTFVRTMNIMDVFGSIQVGESIIQASSVSPDTNPLKINGFRLEDIGPGTYTRMEVYFNKLVRVYNFTCDDIKLLTVNKSDTTLTVGEHVTLIDSDCELLTTIPVGDRGYRADVAVKILPSVFTAASISPIVNTATGIRWMVASGAVGTPKTFDNNDNLLSIISPIEIGPRVIDWFIDMNTGRIVFVFSSKIEVADTFNTTALGFYSTITQRFMYLHNTTRDRVSLSSYFDDSPANDTLATLTLGLADLDRLKALDITATSIYLLTDANIDGYLDNPLVASTVGDAKLPRAFTRDSIKPVLTGIVFDLGNARMIFQFSEPVRPTSVVYTNVRIQSSTSSIANSRTLIDAGGTVTTSGNNATLYLFKEDVQYIVLTAGLANSLDTTFVSFSSNTAADFAGNTVPAISASSALQVTMYVPDTVNPWIVAFDLNMNSGLLTLQFSESVRVGNMSLPAITLQSRSLASDGLAYTLTGGSVLDPDGRDIRVALSVADLREIKNTKGLCRNPASSFLVFSSALVIDIVGNAVDPVVDGKGKAVGGFVYDTTKPQITNILLNVDNKTITFTISEMVQTELVDVTGVMIISGPDEATAEQSFGFTPGTLLVNLMGDLYQDTIVLAFSANDLDTMKYRRPLLQGQNSSYIAVDGNFLTDTFGNSLVIIPENAAYMVDIWLPDVTPPQVVETVMDFSAGSLRIMFDESIRLFSVNISQFTVQSHPRAAHGHSVVISDSTFTSSADISSRYLDIYLSADTMAYMKMNSVGTTKELTYFSFSDLFLTDQRDINIVPVWDVSVLGFNPLPPTIWSADVVAPTFDRWQFERASTPRRAHFHYLEPVTMLDTSKIVFYYDNTNTALLAGTRLDEIAASITYLNLNREVLFDLFTDVCNGTALNTSCVPADFDNSMMNGGHIYVSVAAGALEDLAGPPNSNTVILPTTADVTPETLPNCAHCGAGNYVSTACTETEDRVCAACTSCGTGKYQLDSCSEVANTNCAICNSCRQGKYIETACGSSSDVVCAECTVCSDSEFMVTKCDLGINTLCETCNSCQLPSKYAQSICGMLPKYMSWYDLNCCYATDLSQVRCSELDLQNMIINRREGRHHWTFPDDTVDSRLYGFGIDY